MTTVYTIHRAIGRPVTFKGFQGQYIFAIAGALIADMLLFVILYCSKVNAWCCILVAVGLGGCALLIIGRLSRKYGIYGLMKKRARRKIPAHLRCRSRLLFIQLNKTT